MDLTLFLIWLASALAWSATGYANSFAKGETAWVWPKFLRTLVIGGIIGVYAGATSQFVSMDTYTSVLFFMTNTGAIALIDKILAAIGKFAGFD